MAFNALKGLIQRIVSEEIKKQFAPAPKMGDIQPTEEDDKDRPLMNGRPKDGMDISQHHDMLHAESCGKEHMSEDDDEPIEEVNAIGGGGAGLQASGNVSATSAGSAWDSNKEEHEHMWSGEEPDKFGKKDKKTVKKEEKIGKVGSATAFQMGGSLPDELYNLDSSGKPTRDPGIPGAKKNKRQKS